MSIYQGNPPPPDEFLPQLQTLIKTGLFLRLESADPDHLPRGASRIGGKPDLPAGVDWPWAGDFPMAFIGQINCSQLPDFGDRDLLPDRGRLYFFFEPTQDFAFQFLSAGHPFFKVMYYDAPECDLVQPDWPDSLDHRWRFWPCHVRYNPQPTFPEGYLDKFWSLFTLEIAPEQADWDLSGLVGEFPRSQIQILGHPNPVQGTLEDSAEIRRLSELHPDWDREQLNAEARASFQDWLLLLQVPSVGRPAGIDWLYDLASVYFMIRRQDLIARRFDRVWLGYQDH